MKSKSDERPKEAVEKRVALPWGDSASAPSLPLARSCCCQYSEVMYPQRMPWDPIIHARIQRWDALLRRGHRRWREGAWLGRHFAAPSPPPASWALDNLAGGRETGQACDSWKCSLISRRQRQERTGRLCKLISKEDIWIQV